MRHLRGENGNLHCIVEFLILRILAAKVIFDVEKRRPERWDIMATLNYRKLIFAISSATFLDLCTSNSTHHKAESFLNKPTMKNGIYASCVRLQQLALLEF